METLDFVTMTIMAGMGFVAAFIDSVVGGGGLISVPTLMWAGLPMLNVLGTNKIASTMGAVAGFLTYLRSGTLDKKILRVMFPLSFVGSIIGVLVVREIPPDFLRPLVVVMLIVIAIYSLIRKDWGSDSKNVVRVSNKKYLIALVAIFALGFYDGFFGPGTGSFMLFLFLMTGYGFLGAAANARAANLASNLAAAILFAGLGLVNFSYAIPMGLGMILGAACGAKMAISKGAAYVRPLFIAMTTILIGKQLIELFK
ncbi:MAG: TSUP family transporter [Selenomonadaceae bacterium]|nr:TSUP family transporter [Selenomonadaceae bacterium]